MLVLLYLQELPYEISKSTAQNLVELLILIPSMKPLPTKQLFLFYTKADLVVQDVNQNALDRGFDIVAEDLTEYNKTELKENEQCWFDKQNRPKYLSNCYGYKSPFCWQLGKRQQAFILAQRNGGLSR